MPAVGESLHIDGQDGVDLAKRWLEATGRFDIQWHSGDKLGVSYLALDRHPQDRRGGKSGFDMKGVHLDGKTSKPLFEVYAEIKNYKAPGSQTAKYEKFLVDCASAVLTWQASPPAHATQFMWITWHPFGPADRYRKHVAWETVRDACLKKHEVTGGREGEIAPYLPADLITDELCKEVAARLWFLIAPLRFEDMLIDQTLAA